jgi:NADPH:quinone reductase-like Zn-dependent oxidoreductase
MRAIVRERFGGPDCLVIKEVPEPEPKPGYVVIQVEGPSTAVTPNTRARQQLALR